MLYDAEAGWCRWVGLMLGGSDLSAVWSLALKGQFVATDRSAMTLSDSESLLARSQDPTGLFFFTPPS